MAEGSDEDEETILVRKEPKFFQIIVRKYVRKELEWLLEEQVHKELEDIQHTLLECSRRFPLRMGLDDFPVEEHSFMFRCLGRTGVDLMEQSIANCMLTSFIHKILSYIGSSALRCGPDKQTQELLTEKIGSHDKLKHAASGEYGCLVKPQRILMSSPNNTNQIKCVVTLLGDSICDADISFKHKKGKDDHLFKTAIHPETQWKLQQIQDAGNHLHSAISALNKIDTTHQFKTAKEVQMICVEDFRLCHPLMSLDLNMLVKVKSNQPKDERKRVLMSGRPKGERESFMIVDDLIHSLDLGKSCLCFPKRKSIEDLMGSTNHNSLQPPVPSDVALSFYIHGSKLILALYHLHSGSNSTEISARYQVESNVQWLNEAVILFTLGMQQCQQLLDKIHVIKQYEHVL